MNFVHHKKAVWPIGLMPGASKETKRAWEVLTKKERLLISRWSPFKILRNQLLCDLKNKGLTVRILHELSSVPCSTVGRITLQRKKSDVRE